MPKRERPDFPVNSKIAEKWVVNNVLGRGTFGAVYMVSSADSKCDKHYAMKIENTKYNSCLPMEARIMGCAMAKDHFLPVLDKGYTGRFCYIVMPMHRWSLSRVRRNMPHKVLGLNTVCRLTIQCIEAVEALHNIGYVHRDIKPGNLLLDTDKNSIYLIDFGMARRYRNRDGSLRAERPRASFRGTPYYASINVHSRKDYGRRDDLWGIFYTTMDLLSGQLPWNDCETGDTGNLKLYHKPWTLVCDLPIAFVILYESLTKLRFEDVPQYEYYKQVVLFMMKVYGYEMDDPYDWEIYPLPNFENAQAN